MPSASTSDPVEQPPEPAGDPARPEPARTVVVPFARLAGWIERYDSRHPGTDWTVAPSQVVARSPDGSTATFAIPFGSPDAADTAGVVAQLQRPWRLGVILVRRGGFAVAHVRGDEVADVKIGQRHVQSRTKAGGWSQQRFARRRDNQAKDAYDAAAGHAQRILAPLAAGLDLLVLGGDKAGVRAVVEDPRLQSLASLPQLWVADVADPRRRVLDDVIERARSVRIEVVDRLPR